MISPLWRTLHGQMVILLILCFTLMAAMAVIFVPKISASYQHEITQAMHGHLAPYVVEHYLLSNESGLDLEEVKHTFHDLMILGPNFEFYLLDTTGKILAFSADPEKVVRTHLSLSPITQFLAKSAQNFPLYGDDPRHRSRLKVFSAAKVELNGQLNGYLYVVLGSQIYDTVAEQVLGSHQLRWSVWCILLGLFGCFLMAALLTRVITAPLQRLNKWITQQRLIIQQGKDLTLCPVSLAQDSSRLQPVEVQMLSRSFNALLKRMQRQFDELKNVHELRRELVSHISHDLRTPLASLMGYLETWQMRRQTMPDKDSVRYIGIAQSNAQKMHLLIEQLFELAHLDSGDVKIHFEAFSIAELAQDVLQKFLLTANQKNVQLRVTPADEHIRVVGDIEKLERVLSNLVDNALRHTEAGGVITIRLSSQGHLVAVEVADTGIGIPSEDIEKIFDAHYKAGNSVRGNTSHGGLGLAITKKLLALHNSTIQVTSKQGAGTSFRFALSDPDGWAA